MFPVLLDPGAPWPFAKPRLLHEEGELRLVASPAARPEEVPGLLAALEGSPFEPWETFFDPRAQRGAPLGASRLVSYLWSRLSPPTRPRPVHHYAWSGARLSVALLEALVREVEATGARALVVHLPTPGRGVRPLEDHFATMLVRGLGASLVQPRFEGPRRAYGASEHGVVADAIRQALEAE